MPKVLGYHGTSRTIANKIETGKEPFKAQRNPGDWLGRGVYFWQDAPRRAFYWAEQRYGSNVAVLEAEIDLVGCLDLLDLGDFAELKAVHDIFVKFEQDSGKTYAQKPLNIRDGTLRLTKAVSQKFNNDRDQAFLEFAVPVIADNRGQKVTSIRSAFLYGKALHSSSYLFDWAHVQICVFDGTIGGTICNVARWQDQTH